MIASKGASKVAWCETCAKEIPPGEVHFLPALKSTVHTLVVPRKPGCTPCGTKPQHHVVRYRAVVAGIEGEQD